ncbi:hypothetical protein ASF84_24465 [Pseudomonas sp. Leaf127]|nr:hypothetical protein ASF84_24465 [Pseudomonas sp. Leaf127]
MKKLAGIALVAVGMTGCVAGHYQLTLCLTRSKARANCKTVTSMAITGLSTMASVPILRKQAF